MQGCPLRCLYCHNPDTWDFNCGNEYTLDEVMDKIRRYLPYFSSSGGGVTVSGGEPLAQIDFVTELFKRCRQEKIHTALDTSGYYLAPAEQLFDYTDLVLLDIKHINLLKHTEITGQSNEKAIQLARYLSLRNIPVWIRHVIVPGLTDDESSLSLLGRFIKTLNNVQKIELLPFHKTGEFKWHSLGLEYKLSSTPAITALELKRASIIVENA
jgi:pyruvate formate lyase activating enzyme